MDSDVNSSLSQEFHSCVSSAVSRNIFTAWFTVYLLLLPVFLLVLYIGFTKWRRPRSSASGGGLSHSDVFTLNMVAIEMASVFGSGFALYGYFRQNEPPLKVGLNAVLTTMTGQVLFHSLTCVERYLAVVHPVTYLNLRGEGGVRNLSIAFVWVFSVVYTIPLIILNDPAIYGLSSFCLSISALPLVGYCSIVVLCVLMRPKPGEVSGHRRRIDQSKRSTVYTMLAILGVLLLRLMVYGANGCIKFWAWSRLDACALMSAAFMSTLPSSLVLPLLFLHRTRYK